MARRTRRTPAVKSRFVGTFDELALYKPAAATTREKPRDGGASARLDADHRAESGALLIGFDPDGRPVGTDSADD